MRTVRGCKCHVSFFVLSLCMLSEVVWCVCERGLVRRICTFPTAASPSKTSLTLLLGFGALLSLIDDCDVVAKDKDGAGLDGEWTVLRSCLW